MESKRGHKSHAPGVAYSCLLIVSSTTEDRELLYHISIIILLAGIVNATEAQQTQGVGTNVLRLEGHS